eukprot:4169743-Pyramimonas_sp.AAC.1
MLFGVALSAYISVDVSQASVISTTGPLPLMPPAVATDCSSPAPPSNTDATVHLPAVVSLAADFSSPSFPQNIAVDATACALPSSLSNANIKNGC